MPFWTPRERQFDANRCKTYLKMLLNRLKLLETKKTNLSKQKRREVASLLLKGSDDQARILVEHIIREDYTVEAYEMVRQFADLLLARFNVMVTEPHIRDEIKESVCSLMYSSWLIAAEVPELKQLLDELVAKYGKPFLEEVLNNKEVEDKKELVAMAKELLAVKVPQEMVHKAIPKRAIHQT